MTEPQLVRAGRIIVCTFFASWILAYFVYLYPVDRSDGANYYFWFGTFKKETFPGGDLNWKSFDHVNRYHSKEVDKIERDYFRGQKPWKINEKQGLKPWELLLVFGIPFGLYIWGEK